MKTFSQIVIDHPAERINLPRWISTLSDREYQACSPGHRAAGTFIEGGRLGSVNVESVGGHLLVQHYIAVTSSPHHLVMHSGRTRVYLMHLVPATIEVIWTLDVERRDSDSAMFRCGVETRISGLLSALAALACLPLFVRWHVQGETPLFAKDIARKIGAGPLDDGF